MRMVTVGSCTMTMQEWAGSKGISVGTLKSRLARGMSPERAVSMPVQQKHRRSIEHYLETTPSERASVSRWGSVRSVPIGLIGAVVRHQL